MADEPKWLRALRITCGFWAMLCFGFFLGWTFSSYWPMSGPVALIQFHIALFVLFPAAFLPTAILEIAVIIRTRRQKLNEIAGEREHLTRR